MTFDEVTTWSRDGDAWTTALPPEWMQGRGAFGGILAAAALRAMRTVVEQERTPRSITATFLGPVTQEPARMTANVVRAGKSVAFAEAEITQAGTPRVRFQGVFGASRPSVIDLVPETVDLPPIEPLMKFPHIPKVTPDFIQFVDMRWAEGGVPFTSSDGHRTAGYVRFEQPAARGYERILAMLDIMPAPVLQKLSRPAPASTITWTSHLTSPDASAAGDFAYMTYETLTAKDGYCTVVGKLYNVTGQLIAWQEQIQAIFG